MMKPKHYLTAFTLLLTAATQPLMVHATPRDVSASTSIDLRLDYLEKLLQSRSGERLRDHQQEVAAQIAAQLTAARSALSSGDTAEADRLTREGLRLFMSASRTLPQDGDEISRQKRRYENLRQGLRKFAYAESDNKERFGIAETEQHDKGHKIAKLAEEADAAAAKGEYEDAATLLQQAQSLVTTSLQEMLNHKQLVIELDISTPEKEYFYELRRYMGYEELIPVALEVKRPEPPIAERMVALGEKAKWMSEQARGKAIAREYPVAIRMMMDATNVVREALRMAGVTM